MFEAEFAFRAEADGGDAAVLAEGFFVVAVPAHAFVAVVIEIEQAGVESGAGELLDEGLELGEFRGPDEGLLRGAGVGVGKIRIAIPSDLAGGGDGFAEEDDLVIFPRNAVKQPILIMTRFLNAEDGTVVVHDAIAGQ